jgi:nucleoside-diphosphate-sugar epimerase
LSRAVRGQAPGIYGDGGQSRDFVFVKDVVRANLLAARAPTVAGQRFNIGTGRCVTVNDLWKTVAALAGVAQPPEYRPPRVGDIRESVADIGRAEKMLGFAPEFTFEKGLQITYDWYRSNTAEG